MAEAAGCTEAPHAADEVNIANRRIFSSHLHLVLYFLDGNIGD